MKPFNLASRLACLFMFFILCASMGTTAMAAEPGTTMFEDAVLVAGEEIRFHGGGLTEGVGIYKRSRHRIALGLYLAQRKTTTADVIKAPGAKRVTLKMQQEVESEQLSRSFLNGIRNNLERAERLKIAPQLLKFGELLGTIPDFQKGDVVNVDWLPGAGNTVLTLNGKRIGEFQERAFYDAFLLCFLGERPIDPKLKAVFLGERRD